MKVCSRAISALMALFTLVAITPIDVVASTIRQVDNLGWQCTTGNQKSCRELAKIAVSDKDTALRKRAVGRITDPSLLAKIAVSDKDAAVRKRAVGGMTDLSLLAQIAMEDGDADVRNVAMAKLTEDRQGTTEFYSWVHTEPALLAKVALGAGDPGIRLRAVTKSDDPLLLAKVATEDKDAGVRGAAVAKLKDQTVLAKIATADSDAGVRGAAVARLKDPAILAKIAAADPDAGVRGAAAVTLEGTAWDAAVDPFSAEKVEAFLQHYPHGTHALAASQIIEDEHIIGQIMASGPGSRFVLPSDSLPPFIAKSIGVNTERGRTIIDAARHAARSEFGRTMLGNLNGTGISNPGQVFVYNPLMPCGDLSIFVISGAAYNIQGDTSDPIRLLYSKQYGVIHIGGQGKIYSIRNAALGDLIFQSPAK